jgi:hypothetical protein
MRPKYLPASWHPSRVHVTFAIRSRGAPRPGCFLAALRAELQSVGSEPINGWVGQSVLTFTSGPPDTRSSLTRHTTSAIWRSSPVLQLG